MYRSESKMAGENSAETEKNASGIPKAVFVDDVDVYMNQPENKTAEVVLHSLEEQYNKYKFMEYNLLTKKTRLKSQIPDIRTSLNIVKHMQSVKDSKDAMETSFQLCDTLHVKAKVPPTKNVCLWLGANVMLEYTLDDAERLLLRNEENAVKSLAQVEEDLGFLRDQTTTIEVNMARVYNWDVKRKQAEKASSS